MLAANTIAPDFCLPDERNEAVSLASLLAAGPLVLYFYPADFTPGCTRQACVMRDLHAELAAAGLQVAGVSPQGPESHARFRAEYKLPFVLLSDPGKETIRRYGADGPFGIGVRRVTYLIEALPPAERAAETSPGRGRIADALRADLRIGRHEAFVRRALRLAAAG